MSTFRYNINILTIAYDYTRMSMKLVAKDVKSYYKNCIKMNFSTKLQLSY